MRLRNGTIGLILIMALTGGGPAESATRQDLQNEIGNMNAKLSDLQTKISVLAQEQARFVNSYQFANGGKSALFSMGISTSTRGQTLQIPLSFVRGTSGISSLQQDFVMPSSFTLVSVAAGPSAIAAGKSVQMSTTGGVSRLIIFGLNQTSIDSGIVAIATVRSTANIPLGIYSIGAINPVASDANGIGVPISAISGWVKVQ